ncbi:choice-of-anchor J family PEP-CTERM protein [uncultured Massilia sp.]|uniref:choice-of-anchor J family PEP-CTERM protein n=1 Tax=uncultured Massilia sp. TaxID=169973 RepID=UPI00258D2F21|nr:choice-of-anchor J domain-containing protein [uncultured Massilia sp.]
MMKKALAAMVMSGMMMSAQAGHLLNEGFDDVSTLNGKGWVMNNASTPGGTTGWYQGAENIFSSLDGAPNSYIAANYNNAPEGGMISNWLITPEFSLAEGAIVSFWLRAADDPGFTDNVAFGFSNGSTDLAAFALTAATTVSSDGWMRYTARIDKGAATGNARFALQYTGAADTSSYIGLDRLSISEIPEPSSMLILGAGVMGLVAARRRKRG